jgi:carotenoid cleavage dioxygenase
MVHDVGFTENFVVVLDLPVTLQRHRAPRSVLPYYWTEEARPRLGLLPRSGDLTGLMWFEAPRCFVFHVVNAFEERDGRIVVDVVRHPHVPDHDDIRHSEGKPVLVRWTVDIGRGVLAEELLDDRGCEFPRIDVRRNGQDYRFGYTAHWGAGVRFGPAFKHDVRAALTEVHDFGDGRMSLEPVFVPRVGGVDEDDGYVMAYVYDDTRKVSDVVILAAQDFSGPPLAVIELPVRVPFGFHGDWVVEPQHRDLRRA